MAIVVPKSLLASRNNPDRTIAVRRGGAKVFVLGDLKDEGESLVFSPLIPFTPGLNYEVVWKDSVIATMIVPLLSKEAPEVVAVYPTPDTVPENLLKLYIKFSQPMQQSHSSANLSLSTESGDTVRNAFLDLQPELWNSDQTLLTVWLDPGRIKRYLQPNIKMGAPMSRGHHYVVNIFGDWKNLQGVQLNKGFHKKFVTIARDSLSPDPKLWTVVHPASETRETLTINFHEALDYSLLNDVFHLREKNGKEIIGSGVPEAHEHRYSFTPAHNWRSGEYVLEIETRLEDLAGNNLNRPFDRDIKHQKDVSTARVTTLNVTIK